MPWRFFAVFACCMVLPIVVRAEADWTQFRGPSGMGLSDVDDLPLQWGESTGVVWKTPIVGEGWSSPVVAEGRIWLTSAVHVAASEEQRKAKTEGKMGADGLDVASSISLWATEVDLDSGKVVQEIKLSDVDSPQPIHALNSFASPTPVLSGERLYCHFGDYGTFCLDTASGEILWSERIPLDHSVGPGSSPVLFEDLLILTCDGMHSQHITALNTADGSVAWRTDRPPLRTDEPDFRKSFCTPLLIQIQGEYQLVIPGAQWCVAYEPRTGKEIWRIDHGRGFSVVPRPVFDGQRVYFCTGFSGETLWAVRPDGQGDVSSSHVDWKYTKQIPNKPSPIVFGERLYTISDGGIAQCFETDTGKQLWKQRVGGKYSASPLYACRRLYLCSHEGRTTVIAAGDEFKELATNDLDGQIMASPVVADGDLLLRTESHLYRIGD